MRGRTTVEADSYWSVDHVTLQASLGSGPAGLASDAAAAKLALVGSNIVENAAQLSSLALLARQFASPLVLILAVAAAISLALQQWIDAAIILAIVIGSALLSFFQEYRASTAVEELKKRLALTCRVIRDGTEQAVPVSAIVPGDLILLSAGNLIPADGVVIEAADFLVTEASMTGESFPVEKRPGTVRADAPITERTNCVFLGASVRSGTATALAVKTGRRTEFGAIAARLRSRQPETDFARGARHFGYLLIRVMVVIVLFVLTVTFGVLLHVFHADQAVFQTSWFVISLLTELAVVLVLRTNKSAFRSLPSSLLLWSTLAVTAATFAIPFLGGLSAIFGFVPLSAAQLAAVAAIVAGYILATELAKAWYFRPVRALGKPPVFRQSMTP